jgi:hypothetical protein
MRSDRIPGFNVNFARAGILFSGRRAARKAGQGGHNIFKTAVDSADVLEF